MIQLARSEMKNDKLRKSEGKMKNFTRLFLFCCSLMKKNEEKEFLMCFIS
jgi:hypothetical protein